MKRRLIIIAAILALPFLYVPGFAQPATVWAASASCSTIKGSASQNTIPLTVQAGTTISGQFPGIVTITFPDGSHVTGNSSASGTASTGGPASVAFFSVSYFYYTITVCPPGASIVPLPFPDGRCNQQADQTVAVYPDWKGGYQFYAIEQGVGYFAFRVSEQQLDDNPTKSANYFIAHNLNVWLYRLADGSLLATGLKPDGKLYSYNIGSCGAMED